MPMQPAADKGEQTEAERLRIAQNYREQRGRELRELAQSQLPREVVAAGEFDTLPTEAVAAVPLVGAFLAVFMRIRYSRRKLPASLLLALDSEQVHVLAVETTSNVELVSRLIKSRPRSDVRVSSIRRRFMRDEVSFEIVGEEPQRLYAPPLKMNPWSAEIVRLLGGDAPDPMDLSAAARENH